MNVSSHHGKLAHHTVVFVFKEMTVVHVRYGGIGVICHFYPESDILSGRNIDSIFVSLFIGSNIGAPVSLYQSEMCCVNMKIMVDVHGIGYRPFFCLTQGNGFINVKIIVLSVKNVLLSIDGIPSFEFIRQL